LKEHGKGEEKRCGVSEKGGYGTSEKDRWSRLKKELYFLKRRGLFVSL
jgi:hypothetical protein